MWAMLPDSSLHHAARHAVAILIAATAMGCSKDQPETTAASASASAPAAPAPTPSASAAPSATASAAPEPHHDCPAHSEGIGSFAKPCEAKGKERLMTVKWKKTDDKGPSFWVKNTGKLTILYGKIAVYFYDKKGKQLDVKDDAQTPPVVKSFLTCSGNIFSGVMHPKESAVLTFSCVPKSLIPDGTASIEGEMEEVGFADAGGKKNDFFWSNHDLAPEQRPKGGIKK